jgi:putative two-component system response regulator
MSEIMVKMDSPTESIMIVDDSRSSLRLLESMLLEQGYTVNSFLNGRQALEWATKNHPDLALLDIVMPDIDGFEVCECLKRDTKLRDVPVIFISSQNEIKSKVKAFGMGCVDYITRPFEFEEVRTRVKTHLRLRQMQITLENQNHELGKLVEEKVKEISDSWLVTILALAKLSESRDDDTGKHLERVQVLCRIIAENLASLPEYRETIDSKFIDNIYHASPLHDIGKVGIPDRILLKPGKLDPKEFNVMKQHTIIGAQTLEAVQEKYQSNVFIEMGIAIARSHHERWDGRGYPDGLAGRDIPLCARIMAVADVYDALRTTRCYKQAIPHESAIAIIREGMGNQFDPDVVDTFLKLERVLNKTGMYPIELVRSEPEG